MAFPAAFLRDPRAALAAGVEIFEGDRVSDIIRIIICKTFLAQIVIITNQTSSLTCQEDTQ